MLSIRRRRAAASLAGPALGGALILGAVLVSAAGCKSRAHQQAMASASASASAPAPTATASAAPARPFPGAAPADAVDLGEGLRSKVLSEGKGDARPGEGDEVDIRYVGWTAKGRLFEEADRGKPLHLSVSATMPGFQKALVGMRAGEKRRLWIPSALAYGDSPRIVGQPAGAIVVELELVGMKVIPKVPADLAAPPADAKKTASGLAYRVLRAGKGTEHPTASSKVSVHYSGWSKDGKMFDSSVTRGKPSSFSLGGVIKGWTEGVQLMVVGEKTRFWIPAALAYGEKSTKPGGPSGDLVFDVELLEIKN